MIDFAVVIPTYRRPAYVAQAVESVLGQTHPPSEVVVVCDGPGTGVSAASAPAPVRVIEQPHSGEAVARNTGVAATTAPWVCFLDDDDLWHPDRLRRTAAYLEGNPDCDAVTAPSWTFADHTEPGIDLVASDLAGCLEQAARVTPVTDVSHLDICGRSFELLLERNRGNISGATVRRTVLDRAGRFPAGYTCAADWLMFLNVARYTEWHLLDDRLSFVRRHPDSNTVTNPTNGLVILQAIHEAWAERSRPVPDHPALSSYGPVYRWTTQEAVWGSIRRHHLRLALDTLREGMALLPRARDKAYVLVPPPVTWRVEHRADWFRRPSAGAGYRPSRSNAS